MKFILFTIAGTGLPVAYEMQKKGHDVVVGMIENPEDGKLPAEKKSPEKPEKKAERLSLYDGMLDKFPATKVVDKLKSIKGDKSDFFIFSDINDTFKYSEQLMNLGFPGNFPTAADREMEQDRHMAKEFVKKNYPDLNVAEEQQFKTAEEAKKFLDGNENVYALKSMSDVGETVVPDNDDPDLNHAEIISALDVNKKDYEAGGFILEQKIIDQVEITPEAIFYDGKLVATIVGIENKPLMAGNEGRQTGCAQGLIVHTDPEDMLNQISFPKVVFDMARKRKGLFFWDASVYFDQRDDNTPYFGEFCPNRPGWDEFLGILQMCGGAPNFFEAIKRGENPFQLDFGGTLRLFSVQDVTFPANEDSFEKGMRIKWKEEADPYLRLYEVKKQDGKFLNTVNSWDLGAVAVAGDSMETVAEKLYRYAEMVSFKGMIKRPKFDFLSRDYVSSIPNRYEFARWNNLISQK